MYFRSGSPRVSKGKVQLYRTVAVGSKKIIFLLSAAAYCQLELSALAHAQASVFLPTATAFCLGLKYLSLKILKEILTHSR